MSNERPRRRDRALINPLIKPLIPPHPPPEQNDHYFAHDALKCIFVKKMAPRRREAIIWTNTNPIHWCTNAALGGDEVVNVSEYKWTPCHGGQYTLCCHGMQVTTVISNTLVRLEKYLSISIMHTWFIKQYTSDHIHHLRVYFGLTLPIGKSKYSGISLSILWLLIIWVIASSGHQLPRYWQYRIRSTSASNDFRLSAPFKS